jgi:hypothetical protein
VDADSADCKPERFIAFAGFLDLMGVLAIAFTTAKGA